MSVSIYDFDTQSAPFEAFAPMTPFAPFALLAWSVQPMRWWTDAYLQASGALLEATLGAMIFPYAMPPIGKISTPTSVPNR